jgi:hypothetical protein
MWFCLLHHVHPPPIALIAADQHPLTRTSNFASERSAPFDRTTSLPCDLDGGKAASWRPKHLRMANCARAAPEEAGQCSATEEKFWNNSRRRSLAKVGWNHRREIA